MWKLTPLLPFSRFWEGFSDRMLFIVHFLGARLKNKHFFRKESDLVNKIHIFIGLENKNLS